MPEIPPAVQKIFDFDVRLICTAMKFLPVHLRWIPSQIEARRRIQGKKADLVTRMTNKVVYRQPLLVS